MSGLADIYAQPPHLNNGSSSILSYSKNIDIINEIIKKIDNLLTEQLNEIIHHKEFIKLEASWRGLLFLVNCVSGLAPVQIKVLNIKKVEVFQNFRRSTEIEDTYLFDLIYNKEFGMPGGEPFGVLLCDYDIRHRPTQNNKVDDIDLLSSLSAIGAAAFCPMILNASPDIFGLEMFTDLTRLLKLNNILVEPEYQRFIRLSKTDDSRFIGIALPKILMRIPYDADSLINLPFVYQENKNGMLHNDYCWGNAIYAFGEVLIRSFENHGWFSNISGLVVGENSSGLVSNLENYYVETDPEGTIPRIAAEVAIVDQVEDDLRTMGFMPLTVCKDTEYLVFKSVPSIQTPAKYTREIASINSKISSSLDNILCVSRFAHYLKVQMRDKVGSFKTAADIETLLLSWLAQYATANDNATMEVKSRFPLREFEVEIKESASKPGEFNCKIFLRLHHKIKNINVAFRLQMKTRINNHPENTGKYGR